MLLNKTAYIFMVYMKKIIFVCLFSLFCSQMLYAEENFITFDENWAISLFLNNKNGFFYQTDDSYYRTNRPLTIGLGLSYKWFSISGSFSVPFTGIKSSLDLDFELIAFFNRVYFTGYFKNYHHYYIADTNETIELGTLSAGVAATYIHNYQNHSLESTIKMNKKQNVSNGSLLYSLGVFISSYFFPSAANKDFAGTQRLYYFGPGIGYSYIWVLKNGLFFNTSVVLFTNAGINQNTNRWLFIPLIDPNFVFGYHLNTWSFNIKMQSNITVWLEDFKINSNRTFMGSINIGLTVSKRF